VDTADARRFADAWISNWNNRDLDRVLEPFADEVVFTSPLAARLLDGDGVIRGRDALRAYWTKGLEGYPDLHFDLVGLYVGVHTLVINYRNQAGRLGSEVLVFNGPRVVEGHGTYLDEVSFAGS